MALEKFLRSSIDISEAEPNTEFYFADEVDKELKRLNEALAYCAAGPGELHPANQAQFLVARMALGKGKP